MLTKLQRAFAHSRIIHAAMRDVLADEGVKFRKRDRVLTEICEGIAEALTEPQIKEMLFDFIGDPNSTPAEQLEARQILRHAETALTEKQLAQLINE